jgi:polyphosphate kinase 2 (PPK2 family)
MHLDNGDFRVPAGAPVDLKKWPTRWEPLYTTTKQYQEMLSAHVKALSAQQELLYASDSYAVLLIFQAMDAAGKDGVISHVMSGVNPQGCQNSASDSWIVSMSPKRIGNSRSKTSRSGSTGRTICGRTRNA